MRQVSPSVSVPRRRLSSSGDLELSVLGFGAWEAGGWGFLDNPADAAHVAAMEAAFDCGVNWVDTAERYGRSEEVIAQAVRGRPDILISTKIAPAPRGSGVDPAGLRKGLQECLGRLGRGHIDLFQLHRPDDGVPVEESWGEMARLADEGLVRAIGLSNFDLDLTRRCEAVRHVDFVQRHFSVLHRGDLDEVIPYCAAAGTGYLGYGVLGFGLLTGRFAADTTFAAGDWRSGDPWLPIPIYSDLFAPERFAGSVAAAQRFLAAAHAAGLSPIEAAVTWAAAQDGVTAVTAGTTSAAHSAENARAAALELDPVEVAGLGA